MARGGGRLRAGDRSGGERALSLDGDRAQTTIDFMIGAGVFLLVVGFVLGVIPGMIDPFSDSQETTLVADRLATQVSEGMLGVPDRPTVLNQTCLNAFFNHGSADGEDCPMSFDESVTDLPDRLGVDDRYSINVTVERNTTGGPGFDVVFTDGDSITDDPAHTRLAIGDDPPTTSSVVVASRTAFVDGKDVRVVVRVW